MTRHRGRKDGNHDALRRRFEALGCSVAEFPRTDIPGWPDFVVGCAGVNHLVECKDPATAYGRAGLNANQTAFARDWRGGRVWVCCTEDEATALVQNWRKRS